MGFEAEVEKRREGGVDPCVCDEVGIRKVVEEDLNDQKNRKKKRTIHTRKSYVQINKRPDPLRLTRSVLLAAVRVR